MYHREAMILCPSPLSEIGTGIDALHAPELAASLGTSPKVRTSARSLVRVRFRVRFRLGLGLGLGTVTVTLTLTLTLINLTLTLTLKPEPEPEPEPEPYNPNPNPNLRSSRKSASGGLLPSDARPASATLSTYLKTR